MTKILHWPPPKHGRFVLGLDNMLAALDRLGSPQFSLPPVIHITGTNGKGSTCANLSAIFSQSQYTFHRYTSPHLIEFNERIVLAGKEIDDTELYQLLEECRMTCIGIPVSFFEGTTAAALLAFSRKFADVLIMEVGMGGRLDATNVVDRTAMSIITPISLDHTEYLGESVTAIAGEKAGIIKPDSPCVISWQVEAAGDVLRNRCKEVNAPYLAWGEHWVFQRRSDGGLTVRIACPLSYLKPGYAVLSSEVEFVCGGEEEGIESSYIDGDNLMVEILLSKPGLVGVHQYVNAATSAVSAWWLSKTSHPLLRCEHIVEGISHAVWPGRMQRINYGVLGKIIPQHSELWLDGAHNPAGAEMLSATLSDLQPQLPLYVINGRTMQRDIAGFLQFFQGKAKMICGVLVVSEPSGEKAENIKIVAEDMGFRAVAADSLLEAVKVCLADAGGNPCRIVVCGSLYLAGDVLLANKGIG